MPMPNHLKHVKISVMILVDVNQLNLVVGKIENFVNSTENALSNKVDSAII